jgi:hypothetical protein
MDHALLKLATLSLALKVEFQDYVLERLPIREQVSLFKEHLPKFESPADANRNTQFEKSGGSVNPMEEAQTATCSDNQAFTATTLTHKQSDRPEKPSLAQVPSFPPPVSVSDPDLVLIKFNYEERIKNAL